jgi:cell division protein FtsL
MAAPRYSGAWRHAPESRPVEAPLRRRAPARKTDEAARKKAALRRRSFISLVVVPVALMVGSVYLHTVSADVNSRTTTLEEGISRAEAERESLEVRVAELSGSGRIGKLAEEDLHMRDPGAEDFRVYEGNAEDGQSSGTQRQNEGIP